MPPADVETDEIPLNERPTIPAPRESEVRVLMRRVPWPSITVDLVTYDRRRDPRSEDYAPRMASLVRATPRLELVIDEDDEGFRSAG